MFSARPGECEEANEPRKGTRRGKGVKRGAESYRPSDPTEDRSTWDVYIKSVLRNLARVAIELRSRGRDHPRFFA